MIGKIILGLCIIIAAVVIAKPEYADTAWCFAMGALGFLSTVCLIIVVIVVIILAIIIFVALFT
mgnify:CR=1 FL=1